ncbi:copper-translocating P-type ATPase, variant [Aphanomyces invadans]|uniref:P-type Cu(+) transporter n=1 Tax=Aphanomyces invadans TaxID=157072 RepID=A0A024UVY6_9STRA|nr:copper-translocating P-type ATPase, variant [Aphanomyces invadans]ETW10494.1 copper-translocating P-type ATPase, variant [Aphanomyces invadans]|eukprot:XP_008861905.1 copper-translocating P-type ATPase, variant [Aphanomyces invadans]
MATPLKLVVEGMRCQSKCARRIREALEGVPGVASADVRFQDKSAIVTFADGHAPVSVVDLIQTVRGLDAGLNKHYDAYLPDDDRRARTVVLHIEGMSCMQNCARKVEGALANAAGVKSAKVNFEQKQATVVIEPGSRITEDDLISTVQGAGKKFIASVYVSSPRLEASEQQHNASRDRLPSVVPAAIAPSKAPAAKPSGTASSRVTLAVSGMTCNSCANSVESALRATAGVESCVVNFATESANVKFVPATIGIRSLIEVIEGIGYKASVVTGSAVVQSDDNRQADIAKWRSNFFVALVFTFPIMIVMTLLDNIAPIASGLHTPVFDVKGSTWNNLILFLLATPVQFYCARRFHADAWNGVKHRSLGMSFLVSMGTNAAYFFAVFSDLRCLYLHDPSFGVPDMYMTSSMLVTFIALGKTLEAIAKGRTNEALRKLFDLQAKVATLVVTTDGHPSIENVVPIELVQRGDILKVVRGTSVPADGVITQGEGRLDESMLTGESRLIKKSADDTVLGATINVDGLFYMRVTGVGRDTALSQIVRLVEDAQTSKAPIQAYADQVAAVFVPVVVVLSTVTLLVWYALGTFGMVDLPQHTSAFLFAFNFAISTLVVACPCALGLATPTAVMVGTGVGASLGILIKGGEPLEAANHVDTVLFDKTGTLTNGTPSVTDVIVLSSADDDDDGTMLTPDDLVFLAASAELGSEHPLGRAIVNHAKLLAKPLEAPVTFRAVSGKGISVELQNDTVHLGNLDYMNECGLQWGKSRMGRQGSMDERAKLEAAGKTVIYMGLCDRVVALFGISDAARADARSTVAQLHARGMAVYMVTGDNRRTAHWIAEQVGIPVHHVMAEVLPSNKVAKVQELQASGRVVAMVGDGINDAPALAQANLGIAIGAGTDIAMETAQMVLMKSSLKDVVVAFDLSQTIYRRIQLNFVWAMGYNIVLLPLAAGVLYGFHIEIPPMFAGAAMAFSSVSVLASSLALKWYQPPTEFTIPHIRPRVDKTDERTPLLQV